MKLVLSVDALTPNLTGIGRYTLELVERLPHRLGKKAVRYYRQGRWVENSHALLEPLPAAGSARSRFPRLRVKTPKWLRQYQIERGCRGAVFHGPNYFLPSCAEIGVATVHDLSVFKYPEAHPRARIEHFEREFHLSLSRAAHLITDSQATRDEVIAYLGWPESRITAVPLGVSPRFAPRPLDALAPCLSKYGLSAGTYTLCVSTLEPRKKIDCLLEAYQALPAGTRRSFPLVLAGSSGWLSEKLQRDIGHLSEHGWLRYLRFVPEADLPSIYAGARLFVYPSIYEGFGLPVAEAMASGVPVVTSDRSSLPEVTKGSALLVDPDDVVALAGAIETGLLDDDWRHDARSKGLSVVKDYSWDTCVDRTMEVYGRASRMA